MKNNEFDVFRILYLIKKRFNLFLIFSLLIGVALFLKFHFFTDPIYRSQFTVYTTVLESKIIVDEINNLEKLKESKDIESIMRILNIEEQEAKSLKLLNAKDLLDLQKRMLSVTIRGKDSLVLYKIPILLETMINNTPLYKTTAENYLEYLNYEKIKIESELENITSISDNTNINISIRGTGEFLDKKLKNSENLKNYKVFGLVGSNYISKPKSSLRYNIAAAILGGIAAGALLVFCIEFFVFLQSRMKEYEN